MDWVMSEERRTELELIVALAITRLDLQYTAKLGDLRADILLIPAQMDGKIKACAEVHGNVRKWLLKTTLAASGVFLSMATLAFAFWRFRYGS